MTARLRPLAGDSALVFPDSAIREGIAGKKAAQGDPWAGASGPAGMEEASLRYGLRSPLVEAVRWTGRDRAGWPARLRKTAGEPPGVPGHVSVDGEGNGKINTRIGEPPVVPRRWIVRERERLSGYGTEEFEATSEPAE